MLTKKALVIHSGGMDSSICLYLALREFGPENVLALSFSYHQRHQNELDQAAAICKEWGVDRKVVSLESLSQLTDNALMNRALDISHMPGEPPNTFVVGRNGLMARLGAILAHSLGAKCLYMGVIEVESSNSGYPDCSRDYMNLMQQILRLDLMDATFEIRTPLVYMSKKETLELAYSLGILPYLLEMTITCYQGISRQGCEHCPACILRNEGIRQFEEAHPEWALAVQRS